MPFPAGSNTLSHTKATLWGCREGKVHYFLRYDVFLIRVTQIRISGGLLWILWWSFVFLGKWGIPWPQLLCHYSHIFRPFLDAVSSVLNARTSGTNRLLTECSSRGDSLSTELKVLPLPSVEWFVWKCAEKEREYRRDCVLDQGWLNWGRMVLVQNEPC
jgi:hypothetical protein